MIELELCVATQSWVNREYRKGLNTHSLVAPVLRISVEEVLFDYPHHLGLALRKSWTQLHKEEFRPKSLSLVTGLESTMVLNTELQSMNSILT
jgi:hypothetical protein